jgi:decaprenyl-phosphate phosphoribosyltransferase
MRIIKLLRVHQWLKNVLIFVPILSTANFNSDSYMDLILGFIFFSFFVSATYIVNDLVDIKSDFSHPIKKNRPIASGKISKKMAISLSLLFSIVSIFYFYYFQQDVLLFIILYLFLTILYTLKTKYVKFFDLATIVTLFIIRLLVGGVISNIDISAYLILIVLFLSLAIVTSKKLSIFNNSEIGNTKVKNHLLNSYSSNGLTMLFNSSIFLSAIVYFTWIIRIKSSADTFIFYVVSFLFLLISLHRLIQLTRKKETEEIISMLFLDTKLLIAVLGFTVLTLYSLYYE